MLKCKYLKVNIISIFVLNKIVIIGKIIYQFKLT